MLQTIILTTTKVRMYSLEYCQMYNEVERLQEGPSKNSSRSCHQSQLAWHGEKGRGGRREDGRG